MLPDEIKNQHRKRAAEIVETATHFVCSELELTELIAEGLQAVENIRDGIILDRAKGGELKVWNNLVITDTGKVVYKNGNEQTITSDGLPQVQGTGERPPWE